MPDRYLDIVVRTRFQRFAATYWWAIAGVMTVAGILVPISSPFSL